MGKMLIKNADWSGFTYQPNQLLSILI